jgi:hypothetical protein
MINGEYKTWVGVVMVVSIIIGRKPESPVKNNNLLLVTDGLYFIMLYQINLTMNGIQYTLSQVK